MNEWVYNSTQSANDKQRIAAPMSGSKSNFDALDRPAWESQADALNSASESSDKSSGISYDRSSRGRPRKRTATEVWMSSQSRSKRLKSSYNDDYRGLFNSTVHEIALKESSKTDHMLHQSQIGVTVWSSEEKGAFFRALARRTRHDIRGIATDIGTKSESEVYVYSDMLYKAAVGQQTHRTRKNLLDTSNLEAALEVQGPCCAALDLAAEALSALQENEEEKAEKAKHKELALLTPRIARWVERCMAVPEKGKEEVTQQIPAARLLNLMNFLALSKRFFMNSVTAEENWRSYTERRTKSPSIMHTAFSDFYALSKSITQRLVQSSLFFAMSRLRAMSASGHYTSKVHVRRRDVIAAINVLGMETDAKIFWARAARRCKLRVYEKVRRRQVFGKRYSYVELESILAPRILGDPDSLEMTTKHAGTVASQTYRTRADPAANASAGSISSGSMSVDDGASSALSNDEEILVTPLQSRNHQDHKHEGYDGLQDAYAEALDQQASLIEERRLWEMLGRDPAEEMEPVGLKLPKGPFPHGNDEDELLCWRGSVDYAGDWETYETPVPESSFANDRDFRKDVKLAAGLTSSGSSSGSFIDDVTDEAEHRSDSDKDTDGDGATDEMGPMHDPSTTLSIG